MATQQDQLQQLIRQGFSLADAAEAVGLSVDDAVNSADVVKASKTNISLQEIIEAWKPTGIRLLMEMAESCEVKPRDRISAIQVLLAGEGVIVQSAVDGITDKLDRMRKSMMGIGRSVMNNNPIMEVEDLKDKCFELASSEVIGERGNEKAA